MDPGSSLEVLLFDNLAFAVDGGHDITAVVGNGQLDLGQPLAECVIDGCGEILGPFSVESR